MISKFVRRIFSPASISVNIPSPRLGIQPTLLNMSEELYNDALFFVSQEKGTIDSAIRLRYRRMALICFCASSEAYINGELRRFISNKNSTSRTSYEQKVLDFIEQPTATLPSNYLGIKPRLYRCVGKIFAGQFLDLNNNTISSFEKFIELTEARNAIAHYATKNREVVYDQYFGVSPMGITKSVNDAPKTIFDLYHEIHSFNSAFAIPSWITPT